MFTHTITFAAAFYHSMKIQFIPNINEFDEHMVKLFDFEPAEAELFRLALQKMLKSKEKYLFLPDLEFIEPLNCKLLLRVSEEDEGITTVDYRHFVCDLTEESFKAMDAVIKPFCVKNLKNFNWLYDLDNPIGFLFTPNAG